MKPPGSSLSTRHPAPQPQPQAPTAPGGDCYRLRVAYAPRMRGRRVHPIHVQLARPQIVIASPLMAAEPLCVRPVLPGCHVMPEQVHVNLGDDATATFWVTPLAHGELRNPRLETLWAGERLPDCP